MPDQPSCPTCGFPLHPMSRALFEEHIREKQTIICPNCGPAPAKHWRDGKPEESEVVKKVMVPGGPEKK